MAKTSWLVPAALGAAGGVAAAARSASGSGGNGPYAGTAGGGGTGGIDVDGASCGICTGSSHVPCNPDGTPGAPVTCQAACAPGIGCADCEPGKRTCVGNEVHDCQPDGGIGDVVESCDEDAGETCHDGECRQGCDVAEDQPSNVGCELWAVDRRRRCSARSAARRSISLPCDARRRAPRAPAHRCRAAGAGRGGGSTRRGRSPARSACRAPARRSARRAPPSSSDQMAPVPPRATDRW